MTMQRPLGKHCRPSEESLGIKVWGRCAGAHVFPPSDVKYALVLPLPGPELGTYSTATHEDVEAQDNKTGDSLHPGMARELQVAPPSVVSYINGGDVAFGTAPATMHVVSVGHVNP
jgi:hypothetical protein